MINIGSRLKKEYWKRRIHPDAIEKERHICYGDDYYVTPDISDSCGEYLLLTQEDMLREIEPSAHDINSRYMSTRPIYDTIEREIINEEGEKETIVDWEVTGFDKMETVRFGWQKRIDASKSAYLGGGRLWICHEDKHHENGNLLSSYQDSMGMGMMWQEISKSLCFTCDAAVYIYNIGKNIEYQVFSYLKGDILFPDFDDNRRPILYRLYTLRGRRAVDIYACDYIETWIEGDKDEESDKGSNWWKRFSGWFAAGLDWASAKRSEDGWRRLMHKRTQIGNNLNQCIYFRVDDCPHGPAQLDIEALERAASFVAEGVKSTSQPVLFVKATDIDTLPAQDSHGKTIGVKGRVDELQAADAKFLAVPDLSNIATVDMANKKESILRSTLSSEITAEIFKSGADSSAAISLLFTDEIIWCKNYIVQIYPQIKYLVEVFKNFVDKLEEKGGEIANMRTSCGVDFYLPRNEAEQLKMQLDQVYSRTKSRKAAMSDIGNSHPEDYKQILKEWQEELDLKARVPAVVKAEVDEEYNEQEQQQTEELETVAVQEEVNPELPKVDNNSKGKTILN